MNINLSVALKGFGMGAANVVPGVSGGTVALLTGIYSDIVGAINSLTEPSTWKALLKGRFKEFWHLVNGTFLLWLAVGILASVFSLAKLMTWALSHYPILTWAFFFGLILASIYFMLRDIRGWKLTDALFVAAGIALGVGICTLSPTQTPDSLAFIFLCGAIAVCTMILPGISGSFILVILGKYDFIMEALSRLDIPVLAVFGAGCLVGILAFAKLLHWLLARFEKQTMLVLVGFVAGALVKVWPWADKASALAAQTLRGSASDTLDLQIPWAVICIVAGAALVFILEKASYSKK